MITGSVGISDIRFKFLRRFSKWGELVPAHKQEKLGVWHPRQSGSQPGTEFAGLITFQCQCQTIFLFKFIGCRLRSQLSHDVFRQLNSRLSLKIRNTLVDVVKQSGDVHAQSCRDGQVYSGISPVP